MDPRSWSPAKDTAWPGVEKDTTGMGRGRRPSRGSEAVGPMPDTYGYRSTRPEPGNGGLGAAPRGEGPPSERCPDGRLVITGAPTWGMNKMSHSEEGTDSVPTEPEMWLSEGPAFQRSPKRVLTYNTGGDTAPVCAPTSRRGMTSGYGTGRAPDSSDEEEGQHRTSSKKRDKLGGTPHDQSTKDTGERRDIGG